MFSSVAGNGRLLGLVGASDLGETAFMSDDEPIGYGNEAGRMFVSVHPCLLK